MFFLVEHLFADLAYSQGDHEQHTLARAELLACTQREHGWIGTPWHIQRGSTFKDFSRYSMGVWIAECLSRKENILVRPLPLISKGESDLVLLPSSPKGEIVGIMIHVLYLMATHS